MRDGVNGSDKGGRTAEEGVKAGTPEVRPLRGALSSGLHWGRNDELLRSAPPRPPAPQSEACWVSHLRPDV